MKRRLIPFFRVGSTALLVAALVCTGTAKARGQFGSVPGIGPTAPPYHSPPSTCLPAAPSFF
jgi:hypothetical protein